MALRLSVLLAIVPALTCAQTPSPALLVLNKEGTLAVVDPATRKVVGRVNTGDTPHEVVASSDGKLAFASNYGGATPGNSISVIDLAAMKERRVDLGVLRRPHGLAFADGKLYFTAETNKLIGRFDPAPSQIDWLLGTGQNSTHMIWVNADASQMFTSNIGSDSITMIERSGVQNYNETVIPVGKGPEGFDISPDGKQLWAAGSRDGSVSIIDIFTKRVVHTFNVQTKRSNRLKFTPDGRLVLISDLDAGDLVVLERATRKELKRLKLGRQPAGILVEPDSARAYVAVTGDDNVAVIDLKVLDLVGRIQTGKGPDGMAWIPAKEAAQVSAPTPSAFAVASVKPSGLHVGKDADTKLAIGPAGVSGRNLTLKRLITEAYDVQPFQVSGGPKWLDDDEYDIDARADGPAGKEQLRLMLQGLLTERFGLALHRDSREMAVYELVVDKGGPKIHTDGANPANGAGQRFHGDLRQFANLLSIKLSIPPAADPSRPSIASGSPTPVVDKTGLTGIYDFRVNVQLEIGVDMFVLWQRALQDQLGLKLEKRKGPAEILVVDGALRIPSAN